MPRGSQASMKRFYHLWRSPDQKQTRIVLIFAKRQQAFMLAPTAMFGSSVYVVKTITADNLIDIVIDGPLYKVNVFMVDDMSAEKTVERKYVDPVSFMPMYGLWYPQKKTYKVRYGALWCAV